MRKYLLPVLVITMVASCFLVGCGCIRIAPQEQSIDEFVIYFNEESPILKRHNITLGSINRAMEVINSEAEKPYSDDPSKTQMEAIEPPRSTPTGIAVITTEEILKAITAPPPEPVIPSGLYDAMTSGVNVLEWAIERMDSEILDYRRLSPPTEARTYHGLMVEILMKERIIVNNYYINYKSLLSFGYGDDEALSRAEEQSAERQRLWLLAQDELQYLLDKIGQ